MSSTPRTRSNASHKCKRKSTSSHRKVNHEPRGSDVGHFFGVFTFKLDFLSNSPFIYAVQFIFHIYRVKIVPQYLLHPFMLRLHLSWCLLSTCSAYPSDFF